MHIETEIIKTLLRFSDLDGQSSALQQQLTQLLQRYSDGMSHDQYQRYSHLAHLYVELHHTRCQLAVTSDIDYPNQRNALLSKIAQLQKQLDETIEFRNTREAGQELCQASSFEDFCRLLPQVRLDRLQGRASGKHSCFPLIWAISAREKPLERVQMMVAAGARLDVTDRLGATVLHEMAAMKRKAAVRLPILRFLRLQGADLEARDLKGRTPLHIALERGSTEDVSFFLAVGARVHKGDLKTAVREPAKLQLLLRHIDHDDAMVNTAHGLCGWLEGELYEARLYAQEAIRKGYNGAYHQHIVRDLEESHRLIAALPGPVSQETKLTWVQAPAAFHALKAADTLQAFRAALQRVDITSYDRAGDHPLHWAIRADSDRLQRLWLMLLAGASVRDCRAQDTPLHVFATTKRRDENEQFLLAQMLVQAGAALEGVQYEGLTPLACAIRQRGVFEVRALLRLGADPNATSPCRVAANDQQVSAPLLFGAAEDVRIFKDMLDHGADPSLCSDQGQSLSDYLDAEIYHLQDELNDMGISQNLHRRLKRSATALTKSRDLLQTRLGGA